MIKIIHICVAVLYLVISSTVYAQWRPPTDLPPNGNAYPPLNTGSFLQQTGPLQLTVYNQPNPYPSFSNKDWSGLPGFAIDTDGSLVANGFFSTGIVMANGFINASIRSANARTLVHICSQNRDGKHIPCSIPQNQFADSMAVTLVASPTTFLANTPTSVSLSWNSANAEHCTALSGSGFYTNDKTDGVTNSNPLSLESGQVEQFTIACTNSYGYTQYETLSVTAR